MIIPKDTGDTDEAFCYWVAKNVNSPEVADAIIYDFYKNKVMEDKKQ